MKYSIISFVALFLFYSCSSSDSPEEMEEQMVVNLPSLSTNSITEIGETSATVGGNVSNNGGANVTERGVVWGLTANPTTAGNTQNVGTGTGAFTTTLNGLESNTTYFVRAFAVNSKGTAYGGQQQFTTLETTPVQKIFEGDVLLDTQQKADNFGAEGYTEINGTLNIGGTEIENINSLRGLKIITGDLRIRFASELQSLSGLEELESVGGELDIFRCDKLNDASALGNLREIGDEFTIANNGSLVELPVFMKLIKTGGLEIINNNVLITINNFDELEETSWINVSSNQLLNTISGFNKIETLWTLNIVQNPSLLSLNAFNQLRKVDSEGTNFIGDLTIYQNEMLPVIAGLDMLEEIEEDLIISENSSLTEIETFQNLNSVGKEIEIILNDNLEKINTFLSLTSCNILDVSFNDKLNEINGFTELTTINEELKIVANKDLETVNSFNKLSTLGILNLNSNNLLSSLSSFLELKETQNDFLLIGSPILSETSFVIEKIGGNLDIGGTNLTNLSGFSSLLELIGDIEITANPLLTDFCDITPLFNAGWNGNCNISDNGFNPTCQEISEGVCSN